MRTRQCNGSPPLVSELGIWFDGRSFHYQEYRYDRLDDAVAYAKIDQRRPGRHQLALPETWEQWCGPTSDELALMTAFGISYEGGAYHFREFRYDTLEQAAAYARMIMAPPGNT
jgi:hypothetical protein